MLTRPDNDTTYQRPDAEAARALADCRDWRQLAVQAAELRDRGWGPRITYSRKVFVPLTRRQLVGRAVVHTTPCTEPSSARFEHDAHRRGHLAQAQVLVVGSGKGGLTAALSVYEMGTRAIPENIRREKMLEAYLENGPKMIDFLHQRSHVRYTSAPGAPFDTQGEFP
jgi:hypothetical protein